jgi:hypothetical protein
MSNLNLLEADVSSRLEPIFRAWPMLRGFAVRMPQAAGGEIVLSDVACFPALAESEADELYGAISQALLEIVDERPEALPLLRGRTFARVLH